MVDLSATFNEALACIGYWFLSTILYVTIAAVIWFVLAIPVIKEKSWVSEGYENFVHKFFAVLMILAAIASLLSIAKIGIIPYPIIQ